MKTLTLLFFLWPSLMMAQLDHEVYFDLSADANKLFQVVDNPRTEVDHKGFDFDIEAGVHDRAFGVYLFYGRFEAANYQNYGLGIDYYLIDGQRLDVAAGVGLSRILRKLPQYDSWADLSGYANYYARAVGVFWILENLGVSGRFQYQRRPDIETHGILEGAVGIRYRFER